VFDDEFCHVLVEGVECLGSVQLDHPQPLTVEQNLILTSVSYIIIIMETESMRTQSLERGASMKYITQSMILEGGMS
jgi:hypothetical protein